MTIAISMRGSDGIVIGADTEETISNLARTNCCKTLQVGKGSSNKLVLTGAGDSDYLEAIFLRIANDFLDKKRTNTKDVEADIQKILGEFYKLHVTPFMRLPVEERPDIDLLIGGYVNGVTLTWKTSKNVLSKTLTPCCSAGYGNYMARILFERLYDRGLVPLANLQYLAAYILYFIKKFVPACGGSSNIHCLYQDGRSETLHDIAKYEDVFKEFDFWTSMQTMFVTGGTSSNTKDVSKALSQLKDELIKLHKRLQ